MTAKLCHMARLKVSKAQIQMFFPLEVQESYKPPSRTVVVNSEQ